MRIRATNNVAKLTAVMKLVASSKLRAVEDALARGRPFGVGSYFFGLFYIAPCCLKRLS